MKVNELFYSLQGEGKWTGFPTIFIRTTGCNLRCSYCDTAYAYEGGTAMTIDRILQEIQKYPTKYICITGGEPLLQDELPQLINVLEKHNYRTCIETNGSLLIEPLLSRQCVLISLDIKCPSSHMQDKMNLKNLALLRETDQVKYVIKDKEDYDYAMNILKQYHIQCSVFFQPVWGTDPKQLAQWILDDGAQVQLGLQMHKVVFGEKRRV